MIIINVPIDMLFFPLLIIMFCLDAIIYKIVCEVCQHSTVRFYHIEVVHNSEEFCKNSKFSALLRSPLH